MNSPSQSTGEDKVAVRHVLRDLNAIETGKPSKRNSLSTGASDNTPTKFPVTDKSIKSPKEGASTSNDLPDIVTTSDDNGNANDTLSGILNDLQSLSVSSPAPRVNTNLLTVGHTQLHDSHASSDDEAFLECNSFADESLLLRDTICLDPQQNISFLNETELLNGTLSASCTPEFVDTNSIPSDETEANQITATLADQTVCVSGEDDLKDIEEDRDSSVANTTVSSVNTTVCVGAETTPHKEIASSAELTASLGGETTPQRVTVSSVDALGAENTPSNESKKYSNMLNNECPPLSDEALLLVETSPPQTNITTITPVVDSASVGEPPAEMSSYGNCIEESLKIEDVQSQSEPDNLFAAEMSSNGNCIEESLKIEDVQSQSEPDNLFAVSDIINENVSHSENTLEVQSQIESPTSKVVPESNFLQTITNSAQVNGRQSYNPSLNIDDMPVGKSNFVLDEYPPPQEELISAEEDVAYPAGTLNETVDMTDLSEIPAHTENGLFLGAHLPIDQPSNSTAYLTGTNAVGWNFSHDESMEVDQEMAEPVPVAAKTELQNTITSDTTQEIKDITENSLTVSASTGFSRSTFDDTVLPALAAQSQHNELQPQFNFTVENETVATGGSDDQGNLTKAITTDVDSVVPQETETIPPGDQTQVYDQDDDLNASVAATNQTQVFESDQHPEANLDEHPADKTQIVDSDFVENEIAVATANQIQNTETTPGETTQVFDQEDDLNSSVAVTNQTQVIEHDPHKEENVVEVPAVDEIAVTPANQTRFIDPVDRTMIVVSSANNPFDETQVIESPANTTIDIAPSDEFANMTVNIDKPNNTKPLHQERIIRSTDTPRASESVADQIEKMKANIVAHNEAKNQPTAAAAAEYSAFAKISRSNSINYALNDEDFRVPAALNRTVDLAPTITPTKYVPDERRLQLSRSSTIDVSDDHDPGFNENAFMSSDSYEEQRPPNDDDLFKVPAALGPSTLQAAASDPFGTLSTTSSVSSMGDAFGDQFGLGRIPATAEENDAEFKCMTLQSADFDFLLSKGQNSTNTVQLQDGRSSLLLRFDPLLGRNVLVTQPLVPSILEESLSMQDNHSPDNQLSPPQGVAANATMSVGLIQDIKTSDCDVKPFAHKMEHNDHSELQITELERKLKVELLKTEDAEKKLKEAEQREEALIRRISEKDKTIAKMGGVMEQYENAISELVAEKERVVGICEAKNAELRADRDANFYHLSSLETTFSDLHAKYERSKQLSTQLKECQEAIKAENAKLIETLSQQEQRYEKMKQHAVQQLDIANNKLETLTNLHKQEITKLKSSLKMEEISRISAVEQLNQKNKENEELLKICDELINNQSPGC